jgi:predicted MFS family arabinose efflux permease
MAMAVSPLLGPVLGGVLDDTFGWQSNFVFMAIAGMLVLLLVWFDMGETNDKPSSTFAAQFKTYPELLGSAQFWAYAFCTAFSVGAFFVFISGAPVVAQTVLNLSTKTLGVLIGSITAGYMVGSFLSGRYSTRAGLTRMILTGRAITCIGLFAGFVAVISGYATILTIFGATMFVGLGNGLSVPSSNVGSLSVQPRLAGSAAGLSAALTVAVGAILTSISGLMVNGPNAASILLGMMLCTAVLSLIAALLTRTGASPVTSAGTTP